MFRLTCQPSGGYYIPQKTLWHSKFLFTHQLPPLYYVSMLPLGDSQSRVPLSALLTDAFLQQHSKFTNLRQFLECSGFEIKSKKDFENIAPDRWNDFVSANTSFSSYKEMIDEATYEWFRLGFEAQKQASN